MSATRPLSVLLIEDRDDVSFTLRIYLEACCDFRVSVAPNGEAGIRAALADPPDAVICDIGLPGEMDGFRVARELVAKLPRRPLLIAVTGYGGPAMEEKGRESGFEHYLVKPAEPQAIEALLRAHAETLAG